MIGPNGAGKSTTFNLVTGVLQATRGAITFNGERIDKLTSREIVKRGIGRTFQHVKLLPGMTVLENVAIGAHLWGTTGVWRSVVRLNAAKEARLIAESALQIARVGLEKHLCSEAGSLALGSNVFWRSRGRCAATRLCFCSTNQRQVCGIKRSSNSRS